MNSSPPRQTGAIRSETMPFGWVGREASTRSQRAPDTTTSPGRWLLWTQPRKSRAGRVSLRGVLDGADDRHADRAVLRQQQGRECSRSAGGWHVHSHRPARPAHQSRYGDRSGNRTQRSKKPGRRNRIATITSASTGNRPPEQRIRQLADGAGQCEDGQSRHCHRASGNPQQQPHGQRSSLTASAAATTGPGRLEGAAMVPSARAGRSRHPATTNNVAMALCRRVRRTGCTTQSSQTSRPQDLGDPRREPSAM